MIIYCMGLKSDVLNHKILKNLIDWFFLNIENISLHYKFFSKIVTFQIEEQKTLNRIYVFK